MMETDSSTGKVKVYTKEPNFAALKFLAERVMGSLPSRIEITGADDGPVEFVAWSPPEKIIVEDSDIVEGEVIATSG